MPTFDAKLCLEGASTIVKTGVDDLFTILVLSFIVTSITKLRERMSKSDL